MSALSDRLKETAQTVKQQALEAKRVHDVDAAAEVERRSAQTQRLLEEKLCEILPQTASIKFDGVTAIVDAGTTDELRFKHNMGPVLLGICPKCEQECESAEVYSLHQLGELLTEFEPAAAHMYTDQCAAHVRECQANSPAERLVASIREVLQ